MRLVQTSAALLVIGTAVQADGTSDLSSISLIETTVVACTFDTGVEVVGLRKGPGEHLRSLGAWSGAVVVQDGLSLLLTLDGMSLHITYDRATWEWDGGPTEKALVTT